MKLETKNVIINVLVLVLFVIGNMYSIEWMMFTSVGVYVLSFLILLWSICSDSVGNLMVESLRKNPPNVMNSRVCVVIHMLVMLYFGWIALFIMYGFASMISCDLMERSKK